MLFLYEAVLSRSMVNEGSSQPARRERFNTRMRRQRSEAILREAARMIVERGCGHVPVEELAGRVGVAKGTVYLDFGNKDELLDGALSLCADILSQRLEAASTHASGHDRLGAAVSVLSKAVREEPGALAVLQLPISGDNAGHYARVRDRLAGLIAEDGSASNGVTRIIAEMALAMVTLPSWRTADDPDPLVGLFVQPVSQMLARGPTDG